MLVLSRRPSESILIGDDIRVTVTQVRGQQVRIAIDAPPTVLVDRAEIRQHRSPHDAPLRR